MSKAPAASVVIPSYNHARFIEAAVESVLDSDMPEGDELEVIILDDGSTDDSLERLERFRADPRVRLDTQKNRGAHVALNRAVAASRGDFVFILNSDDLFHPQRIQRCLERFATDPGLVMLASWLKIIDADGKKLGVKEAWRNLPPWPKPRSGPGLADTGDAQLALLETNYISTTSNVAVRRSVFERGVRFQPLRYAHDWDFLLAASEHGRLGLIEEPLVSYRVHDTNTIRESEGEGQMRFEILWVVARHASRQLRARATDNSTLEDLWHRFWNSAPRFEYGSILSQLLVLRGDRPEPPPSYDSLLVEGHPFRRRAILALASSS